MQPTYYMGSAKKSNYARLISYGDGPDDQMTQIVNTLQTALDTGKQQASNANGTGFINWITGASDTEGSIAAQLNQTQTFINQLNTDLRNAVDTGTNAAGNPYTIDQWLDFAKTVANDIKSQTGYAVDSSGWQILINTYNATKGQVTDPLQWPWWLWLVAAGGALIVLNPVLSLAAKFMSSRKTATT